jgi:hypothetical protein
MSLTIDVGIVSQVLLADGWHDVSNASFDLDAYEFVQSDDDGGPVPSGFKRAEPTVLLAGGRVEGVPSTGATWRESDGSIMYCPITAVLAVRVRAAKHKGENAADAQSECAERSQK